MGSNPETLEQLLDWLMRKRARLQKMQDQFASHRSKRLKDKLLALEMQAWEIEDIVADMANKAEADDEEG